MAMKVVLALAVIFAGGVAWSQVGSEEVSRSSEVNQGVILAQEITKVTGIAISPLLGISALGALEYFRNPDGRSDQPWFCSPIFWAPALCLVLILLLKDPLPLPKKHLDVLEVVENKVSAIVVAPTIISILWTGLGGVAVSPGFGAGGTVEQAAFVPFLGSMNFSDVIWIVAFLVAIFVFFAVWMAGHVVNLLILVSPFPLLDMILKGLKYSVLTAIVVSNLVNPYLGLLVSVAVIIVSLVIFGWTYRWSVFGTVASLDIILAPWVRKREIGNSPLCFAGPAMEGVPNRTFGRIRRSESGTFRFSYKPWLIFRQRMVEMPGQGCFIGKEVLCPTLHPPGETSCGCIAVFPSRYLGREEELGEACGLQEIRDMGLRKLGASLMGWFKMQFNKTAQ